MTDPCTVESVEELEEGLEEYVRAIHELVLWLRDEGHILSSMDQHVIESWWEAGYPLDTVLGAVRDAGTRLRKRKNAPRGLPLKSIRRAVDKVGRRAVDLSLGASSVGRSQSTPPEQALPLQSLLADVERGLEGRTDGPERLALRRSLDELGQLQQAGLGAEQLFSCLLGVGRRYYEALDAQLAPQTREAMSGAILDDLGDAVTAMDPDALDQTVCELRRRWLRREDPILDPDRYWGLE
jgi:hypothetical protein